MAVTVTPVPQVAIDIDLETATKLLSLLGLTASDTFDDLYDEMVDAGIKPMQYTVKTYGFTGDLPALTALYLEKRDA